MDAIPVSLENLVAAVALLKIYVSFLKKQKARKTANKNNTRSNKWLMDVFYTR